MKHLELAKHHNLIEETHELVKVPFLDDETFNSFQRFVLTARLWHFLRLKILFDLVESKDFCIGYTIAEYVGYTEDSVDEEDYVEQDVGPAIAKEVLTTEHIINLELETVGFKAVIADAPYVRELTYYNFVGDVEDQVTLITVTQRDLIDPFYVATDCSLLFMQDAVYCLPELQERVAQLVNFHNDEFRAFLEKYRNDSIDHQIYVAWLQKLFPGKIKIRSLE